MATLRLHKFLSQCGISSRRKSEILIRQGRVCVNGQVVTDMGVQLDPQRDKVSFLGKIVRPVKFVYFLLNKPKGIITTSRDTHQRVTVVDLIPKEFGKVFPVGRLDKDSEGLLILTNDGELAFRLMHPRFGVTKIYEVLVLGNPRQDDIAKLNSGIYIDGRMTAPAKIKRIGSHNNTTAFEVEIHEGRKHQVRKMLAHINCKVLRLVRIKYGPVLLKNLRQGQFRRLLPEEVRQLKIVVGI